MTYIVGVPSPAIACKQLQGMATESGTSVRGSYINFQTLQKLQERTQKK